MFPTKAKDDTVTTLENAAHEMKDNLQNAANQAGRKVRSVYNTASDDITHASDAVTGEIRNNPLRSTAIALGIGVLLGALLRR